MLLFRIFILQVNTSFMYDYHIVDDIIHAWNWGGVLTPPPLPCKLQVSLYYIMKLQKNMPQTPW